MIKQSNVVEMNQPIGLKMVAEVDLATALMTDSATRIKKARLKLTWLESYIYDCLQLEAKEQKTETLEIIPAEFCAKYQFSIGANLDKNALTIENVTKAIQSIDEKEGLYIKNRPDTLQLRLF